MPKSRKSSFIAVVLTLVVVSCSINKSNADDLVGHWRFDENSGTSAADSTSNGNDGTLVSMTAPWVSGRSGYALQFDGTDDYVSVPHDASLSITKEITIEAWVKPDTRVGHHVIACKGSYTFFFSVYNGKAALLICKSGGWNTITVGSTALDSSKWYHLAGTFKNGVGKVYVNGVLDAYDTGDDVDILSNTSDVSIGSADSYTPNYYFSGVIDELKIYERAFDASGVFQNYLEGISRGHWKFSEGTGATATDISGNGNTGTLTNMDPPDNCWVDGIVDSALAFDGTDDYVSVPHDASLSITKEITIEAWVKPDTGTGHHVIACKGSYTFFFSVYNGKAALLICKSGGWNTITVGSTALDSSKWYHLAGTYKDGVGKVYVNGVLDASDTGDDVDILSNTSDISIGSADSYSPSYRFNGVIDEVQICDRALSENEILVQYENGRTPGRWKFDEFDGSRAFDSSGNDNTGTLTNMDTPDDCWVDGRIGSALSFDGSNDYVLIADTPSLNIKREITVEAVVKPDTASDHHVIACKGAYTFFFSVYNGRTTLLIGKSTGWNTITVGSTILDSSKWYHLAGTYKDGVGKVYVNGVLDGTDIEDDVNIPTNTSPVSIGSADSYTSNYRFNGIIDEVNLFNMALSATEIDDRFECHGGEYGFGCEEQPTGNPVGGGSGYIGIYTSGDYEVDTSANLISALSSATSGDVIFVSNDIDLTGKTGIIIPGGVTLAGNRGANGTSAGAKLYADQSTTAALPLFITGGDDVRITGLRIQGPHTTVGTTAYDPPVTRGIQIAKGHANLEVDNCEISGWSHAAIYFGDGEGTADAYVHHNYIHHCQRTGLGYGVSLGYGGTIDCLIEANIFDYMRHCVAGSGTTGNSYEARYNLVLENTVSHVFDMHGGVDRDDGTNIAGDSIYIHHNTVEVDSQYSVYIRGVPNNEALIYNNRFYRGNGYATKQYLDADENFEVYNNLYTQEAVYYSNE